MKKPTLDEILKANGLPTVVELLDKKVVSDNYASYIMGVEVDEGLLGKPSLDFTLGITFGSVHRCVKVPFDPRTLMFKKPIPVRIV